MVAFGIARDEAERWVRSQLSPDEIAAADTFEVWGENWQTVQTFLALQTQWRIGQAGATVAVLGLDYACAWAFLNGVHEGPDRQGIFLGLCIMERAALPILNRKGS